MDVQHPSTDTIDTYYCEKCQSQIWTSIQFIHSSFCSGSLPYEALLTYTDEQIYELGLMIQDHPLTLDAMVGYAPQLDSEEDSEPSIKSKKNQQQQQQQQPHQISRSNSNLSIGFKRKNKDYQHSNFSPQKTQSSTSSATKNSLEPTATATTTTTQTNQGLAEECYQCAQCFDFVRYDGYYKHQSECRDQGVKCEFCYLHFPFNLIEQHERCCQAQSPEERLKEKRMLWGKEQSQLHSPNQQKKKRKDWQASDDENNADEQEDQEEYKIDRNIYNHRSEDSFEEQSSKHSFPTEKDDKESDTASMIHKHSNNNNNNGGMYPFDRQGSEKGATNNVRCDWSYVAPERFMHALDIIFPPFTGQTSEFKRQQAELFRQNLIVRLVNISRHTGSDQPVKHEAYSTTDRAGFGRVKYTSKNQREYKICSICMCDFEEQEDINILPCMHRFHVECISKWLQAKPNCPVCKRDMSEFL